MLQAELAGHAIPEALSSEDYLTSAAFGLLKYIDSRGFWENVFHRAVCVGPSGERISSRFRFTEYGVWQRFATNLATWPQLFDPEEIIDSILFAGSVID